MRCDVGALNGLVCRCRRLNNSLTLMVLLSRNFHTSMIRSFYQDQRRGTDMARKLNYRSNSLQSIANSQFASTDPSAYQENYVSYQLIACDYLDDQSEKSATWSLCGKRAKEHGFFDLKRNAFCGRCNQVCSKNSRVYRVQGKVGVFCRGCAIILRN